GDAAEIKTKARERLTRAGERAFALAAGADARRYFDQAAQLADDALTEAELLERAGDTAFAASELETAIDRFERAVTLFESESRTHSAARVSASLGRTRWHHGQIETAIDEMEKSYAVLVEDE